jgi:hypothetical protein
LGGGVGGGGFWWLGVGCRARGEGQARCEMLDPKPERETERVLHEGTVRGRC